MNNWDKLIKRYIKATINNENSQLKDCQKCLKYCYDIRKKLLFVFHCLHYKEVHDAMMTMDKLIKENEIALHHLTLQNNK